MTPLEEVILIFNTIKWIMLVQQTLYNEKNKISLKIVGNWGEKLFFLSPPLHTPFPPLSNNSNHPLFV